MFSINEDKSIYCTRGDECDVPVEYALKAGDVVRIKVTRKKDCKTVMMQRDVTVGADTEKITIHLGWEDTKIGDVISKPTDYWYEIEVNPDTAPVTITGYDEDGPKIFRLYPEGKDVDGNDIEAVGKQTLDELMEEALKKAKESGEFDGPAGPAGPTGPRGPQGPQGDPGPEEIFIAKYGVTTLDEMEEAYQAGKALFLRDDTFLTPLHERSSAGSMIFYRISSGNITNLYCTRTSGWNKKSIKLCDSRFTAIEESLGDIDTALDTIIAIQESLIGGGA